MITLLSIAGLVVVASALVLAYVRHVTRPPHDSNRPCSSCKMMYVIDGRHVQDIPHCKRQTFDRPRLCSDERDQESLSDLVKGRVRCGPVAVYWQVKV